MICHGSCVCFSARVSFGRMIHYTHPQAGSSYTTEPLYSKRDISSFTGIGVTVEPAQGSEQPTGPGVFRVDF